MSVQTSKPSGERTSILGTVGWVAVTVVLAVAAVLLLDWLGPVGGR